MLDWSLVFDFQAHLKYTQMAWVSFRAATSAHISGGWGAFSSHQYPHFRGMGGMQQPPVPIFQGDGGHSAATSSHISGGWGACSSHQFPYFRGMGGMQQTPVPIFPWMLWKKLSTTHLSIIRDQSSKQAAFDLNEMLGNN